MGVGRLKRYILSYLCHALTPLVCKNAANVNALYNVYTISLQIVLRSYQITHSLPSPPMLSDWMFTHTCLHWLNEHSLHCQ